MIILTYKITIEIDLFICCNNMNNKGLKEVKVHHRV